MKPITKDNHVARSCNAKAVLDDGRVSGAAFVLRSKDNGYLSVNWMEQLGMATMDECIAFLHNYYQEKIKGKRETIAVLNVDATQVYVKTMSSQSLDFYHHEKSDDTSYSGIYNLTVDDIDIPELIALSIHSVHSL